MAPLRSASGDYQNGSKTSQGTPLWEDRGEKEEPPQTQSMYSQTDHLVYNQGTYGRQGSTQTRSLDGPTLERRGASGGLIAASAVLGIAVVGFAVTCVICRKDVKSCFCGAAASAKSGIQTALSRINRSRSRGSGGSGLASSGDTRTATHREVNDGGPADVQGSQERSRGGMPSSAASSQTGRQASFDDIPLEELPPAEPYHPL